MQVQDGNEPYDDINVTPMLDLAYVLLVIFIIMTTASVQGVKVKAPQTVMAGSLAKQGLKAITVTQDGSMYLDAYPVNAEQLAERLGQYKSVNPSLSIVIKGDANAQYDKVMEVMEILKKLDITEIGLVTKRVGPEG